MSAVSCIELILRSDLLVADLIEVPSSGLTERELLEAGEMLARPLSIQHRDLLSRWNGLDLEVVRVFGYGDRAIGRRRIEALQKGVLVEALVQAIVFADDPAGFAYAEAQDGSIYSAQASELEARRVADSVNDFFEGFVFGPRAAIFGGEEWAIAVSAVRGRTGSRP